MLPLDVALVAWESLKHAPQVAELLHRPPRQQPVTPHCRDAEFFNRGIVLARQRGERVWTVVGNAEIDLVIRRLVLETDDAPEVGIVDADDELVPVVLKERLDRRRQQVDRPPHDEAMGSRAPGQRRRGHERGRHDQRAHQEGLPHAGILRHLDNLTHSLFGVTLARTPLSRAGRGTTAALVLASNAPDVDIVTTAGGAVKYLEWHRGMTHGPIGVVGLAVISAALVWCARPYADRRWPPKTGAANASFGMLVAVSLIGVLLHVLMDLPTSYGTRLLSPFDWHWFAVDWMPILDIYLLMALVIGLLGRSTPSQRRAKAAFVLLLMATNYGVRAAAHHQALEVAPRLFGPTLPPPCDPPAASNSPDRFVAACHHARRRRRRASAASSRWRRCRRSPRRSPGGSSRRCRTPTRCTTSICSTSVIAIQRTDRLRTVADDAALSRTSGRRPSSRRRRRRLGQVFLGFSRMPAARSAVDAHGVTTVRWTDVRFAGGSLALDQQGPRTNPFTATVRIAPDGQILDQFLGLNR